MYKERKNNVGYESDWIKQHDLDRHIRSAIDLTDSVNRIL